MRQHAESRTKSDIESDIHEARNRLDNTLTALQSKLSPQQLVKAEQLAAARPGNLLEPRWRRLGFVRMLEEETVPFLPD